MQPTPQRTAAKSREQSSVAMLYILMFALESHMPTESLEHEMERSPAAYAIRRYHKLGGPSEAAGEMAKTATKRAKNICANLQSHQELWISTNVVFHKCGITQMWISTNVDFHKWEIIKMSSCAKDRRPVWVSTTRGRKGHSRRRIHAFGRERNR